MKKKASHITISSAIVLLVIMIALTYVSKQRPTDHMSLVLATMPFHSLYQAQTAFNDNDFELTLEKLEEIIEALGKLEKYSDTIAIRYIHNTVADLVSLEIEFLKKNVNKDHLNKVFFETLTTLAYADLRISETDFAVGDKSDGIYLLAYASLILEKSMRYTNDRVKVKETIIINQINGILDSLASSNSRRINFDQINEEIEALLENG